MPDFYLVSLRFVTTTLQCLVCSCLMGSRCRWWALGSWRGSYKDCANNNYSCAQGACPTCCCSLGSKVLAELMWILTLVDWRGTTFWRFDWIWLVDWVVSLNHWCTECKVPITASTSPSTTCGCIVYVRLFPWKSPSNTTEGMRSVISIPPAPRNNGLKQWFTRFDLKIRLLTNDGFSQREAYVGLFWSKTTMLARRLHVRLHIGPDIKSGQRLPNTGPGGRSIESFWTLTWAGLCHHEVPWSHRFQCRPLQCTSAESLEDSMATLEKADASNGEMPLQ